MRVLLARPRGFCAGVDRAIKSVDLAIDLYGAPVYVKHEIVHNTFVVERLRTRGAVFVNRVDEIPEGAVTVFSAHGSPPGDYDRARERRLRLIDATCPLVTKVHLEARRYAREGATIILIGHRGHVEPIGTMGEAPDHTVLIETIDAARTITVPDPEKVAYLTQTTLSVDETEDIIRVLRERFPKIVAPPSADICYATTNRQQAVKVIAAEADVVLVVGSKASSNSNRLRDVAVAAGIRAYLVDRATDIDPAWLTDAETVGVTAGASVPDVLVDEVLTFLRSRGASSVEEVAAVTEHVRFPLPPELLKEAAAHGKDSTQLQKHTITRGMVMRT